MIFFLLHHLFQILPITDLRRNCLTFLIGSIIYFLLRGYLQDHNINWITRTFIDWFWYLLAADVVAMGIIYREYYGRSIVEETFSDPEKWQWDAEQHKYVRTDLSQREEYFRDKLDALDQVGDKTFQVDLSLRELNSAKEKLDKIDQLEENLNELDQAFRYRPDGEEAKELKEHFNQLVNEQLEPTKVDEK